jgi:hypothetical protein
MLSHYLVSLENVEACPNSFSSGAFDNLAVTHQQYCYKVLFAMSLAMQRVYQRFTEQN